MLVLRVKDVSYYWPTHTNKENNNHSIIGKIHYIYPNWHKNKIMTCL